MTKKQEKIIERLNERIHDYELHIKELETELSMWGSDVTTKELYEDMIKSAKHKKHECCCIRDMIAGL